MKKVNLLWIVLIGLLISSCNSATRNKGTIETDENGYVVLTDGQIENMIKRSYQYVAMYNVNNKFALAETGMSTGGYNQGLKNTQLLDHTVKAIARPNNDVL